jgi:HAD superfamily hydrolase (TIGR01509 family)
MLCAIIFDFDGVVADTEPVHLAAFQRILGEQGFKLSSEEYYAEYLGYDDRGCFRTFLTAHGHSPSEALLDDLVARKAKAYLEDISRSMLDEREIDKAPGDSDPTTRKPIIFPGVREFVREAAARYRLAIASGALRHEIEHILECAGLHKEFEHITSAEDVRRGKPDPEPFLHALTGLNRLAGSGRRRLKPANCLVIEDSIPGIRSAHAAGMKVLAVANTHTIQDLHEADALTHSLADVKLPELEARLWPTDAARHGAR